MQIKHMWNRVPATAALIIAGALGLTGVACGLSPSAQHDLTQLEEAMTMFDIPGVQFTGTCVYNASNGNLVLNLLASDQVIIGRDSGNGNISINGNSTQCQNANYANVKLLSIVGPASSGEVVVLDYSNGTFATSTGTATTGTWIDLGGDVSGFPNDQINIRTTNSNTLNQNITIGTYGIYLTAQNFNDILLVGGHNPNWLTLALGAGNDTVRAAGKAALGGAAGSGLTIYGNSGADTFYTSGSNSNDQYVGGDGNDTIYVAATVSTGHQVYDGGNNLDTIDFSSRVLATKVYDSNTYVSGDVAGNENCRIANFEVLTGGSGPDILQGAVNGNTIWLNGGPGNDNFIQGGTGASDSNDIISGGAGIDTVNYKSRTISVNVTLDGNPNDGSVGEIDNIGLDVENVYTGSGADLVVGNANSNVLDAGAGTNTVQGNGGDDTFLQTVAGTDTIACGAGTDTIDYSPRATLITAALDGTTASGFTAEADVLGVDCENLTGAGSGSGAQTLTGNAGDNVISGGAGTGAVVIDCKNGEDIAINDNNAASNTVSNCEIVIP